MYKEFSSHEMLCVLTNATKLQKIHWVRVTEYLFYNGRNKALLNYTELFTESKPPQTIRDVPNADLSESYYCEYGGAAFCLMCCIQVLEEGHAAQKVYNFMVQCDPYDNFSYYNASDIDFQNNLLLLIDCVKEHVSLKHFSHFSLNKTLLQLQDDISHFNPETDIILTPPSPTPPHKHSCVIDSNGFYITFVLVLLKNADGTDAENVQNYDLKSDEYLLDVEPPLNLVKAHWNGHSWEEGATEEEIAAYRHNHQR